MAESLPVPIVTFPVSCLDDSISAEPPPPQQLSETVTVAETSSDNSDVVVELNDESVRSEVEVEHDSNSADHSHDENSETLPATASHNTVIAGLHSEPNESADFCE